MGTTGQHKGLLGQGKAGVYVEQSHLQVSLARS